MPTRPVVSFPSRHAKMPTCRIWICALDLRGFRHDLSNTSTRSLSLYYYKHRSLSPIVRVCACSLSYSLSRARARGRASLLSTKSDVPRPIWMAGFGDYPHEVCRRGMEVSHPLIHCRPRHLIGLRTAVRSCHPRRRRRRRRWPWSSLSADLMWWCLISCGVCGELARATASTFVDIPCHTCK